MPLDSGGDSNVQAPSRRKTETAECADGRHDRKSAAGQVVVGISDDLALGIEDAAIGAAPDLEGCPKTKADLPSADGLDFLPFNGDGESAESVVVIH